MDGIRSTPAMLVLGLLQQHDQSRLPFRASTDTDGVRPFNTIAVCRLVLVAQGGAADGETGCRPPL
jgi:hypothetical protein